MDTKAVCLTAPELPSPLAPKQQSERHAGLDNVQARREMDKGSDSPSTTSLQVLARLGRVLNVVAANECVGAARNPFIPFSCVRFCHSRG